MRGHPARQISFGAGPLLVQTRYEGLAAIAPYRSAVQPWSGARAVLGDRAQHP